MDNPFDLMKALHAGRIFAGLIQDKLALKADVTRQMIIRVENGDAGVPAIALTKIMKALEAEGVLFIHANDEHGPGVALKTKKPR